MDLDVVLSSDGVTRVVRIGETVRRPTRPFTETVQAYLAHLQRQEFHGAPVPLGFDEHGREVLSYVAGEVPIEPLPAWAIEPSVLRGLGRLIRQLHDASQSWVPPASAVWGNIPGLASGILPNPLQPELVSHQDYCPGNVVFLDGEPVALIDFDLARPTTRVDDLANAMHWWVPLADPTDRPDSLKHADLGARVRTFADAYEMSVTQRRLLLPAAVRRAYNSVLTMQAAAEADPVFRCWWDEGLNLRVVRTRHWLAQECRSIEACLLA